MKYGCVVAVLAAALPLPADAALPTPPDTLWAVTYDAGDIEKAYRARPTSDGGFIICGSTRAPGPGDTDAYIVKTGGAGDAEWSGNYGGSKIEEAFDIQQTADGGYVAVGYTSTNTAGYYDVYLVRIDAGGDTLWTRAYGGVDYDYGYSVDQTADGGFIIAGRTSSFGSGWRSTYFIRTDAGGDTLWTRVHGGAGKDEAYSIVALPGGGYMAAGYTESRGAGASDVWLLRLDADGDTLWTRTYGGELDERGEDIRRTADKGFIIAGRSNSFSPPYNDFYVVRVDASGNTLWTRTYGGDAAEHAYSVSPAMDGGFIAAGYTKSFGEGVSNAYLVRCDADGDTMWTKTMGGQGSDCAYSAEQTTGGRYMVSGYTFSMGTGDGDAFLAELAPSGGCPLIEEVADVPSDDGGYVEISWLSSFYDNPALEKPIKRYKIWRKVKDPAISLTANQAGGRGGAAHPADRYELMEGGALWEQVGQVAAESGSLYAYVAPTDCGPFPPQRCRGCFFVSAHTGTLGGRFASPPACGTSINNLLGTGAPATNADGTAAATGLRVSRPAGGMAQCRIDLEVPEDGTVRVEVFSVTGRKVSTIFSGRLEAGKHSIPSGAIDGSMRRLASGTYLVRLRTPRATVTEKLVIIR